MQFGNIPVSRKSTRETISSWYGERPGPFDRVCCSKRNDGGLHVDDSTHHFSSVVGRSSAGLALQQRLGILPQRGFGFGSHSVAGITSGRATVSCRPFSFDVGDLIFSWGV